MPRTNLDELPIFKENPFNNKSDVPIFEYAFLVHKTTPPTNPPYNRVMMAAVVGRSPDGKTIYYSRETMSRGGDYRMDHTAVYPNGTEGFVGEERFENLEHYHPIGFPLMSIFPM